MQVERKLGAGSLTSPVVGASPSKDPVGAGKQTLVEAVQPAPAAPHAAAAPRVAEREGEELNAMIKVVAYDARGKVITTWGARSHWDGPLPQRFHGQLAGSTWTWDNPDAASVRLDAKADGTGGVSVERWAAAVHAARIAVMADDADEVATRNDRHYGEARDPAEPGLGEDEHNAHASPGGLGATDGAGKESGAGNTPTAHAGAVAGPAPGAYTDPHGVAGGVGTHAATSGTTSGVGGSGGSTGTAAKGSGDGNGSPDARTNKDEAGSDAVNPDEVDDPASRFERELDEALGDEEQEKEGEPATDEPSDGGNGYAGGSTEGRAGRDAATDGHGPGGKRAHHDGDGTGADVPEDNRNGTKFGSRGGSEHDGAHDGMAGGEGKPGDRGVPSAMGLWSVIPVPEPARGGVELGMILLTGDIGGDITGLGASLFRRGLLRGEVAIVRRMVSVGARDAARQQMIAVLEMLHASPQFMAMTQAEKTAIVKMLYWDKQSRFFRGFLAAAREEEAAAMKALAKAKPSERGALKARAAAAKEGEQVALAEPVAGRLPVNHAYAGGEFPRKLLPPEYRAQGLKIKASGHPDLTPYARTLPNGQKNVVIEFTGSYDKDFQLANDACGYKKNPEDWVWHHVEDGRTMQLVPQDLHDAVKHSGGVAKYRHIHGVGYGR